MQKTQIFIIHGGDTFKNKRDYLKFLQTRSISIELKNDWKDNISRQLNKDFEVIFPRMPCKEYAHYNEWKIHFERFFPYLRDNIILIGNSLGGIFLAKYLSEYKFPKKIKSLFLVAAPFDNSNPTGKYFPNRFRLKSDLSFLQNQCADIILMFSKYDKVVPLEHAEKYRKKLPNAKIIIYKSKNGHFKISKFPEIVKMIKNDVSNLI